jgi:hypothetical protein
MVLDWFLYLVWFLVFSRLFIRRGSLPQLSSIIYEALCMEFIILYAMTFLGTPYNWGGDGSKKLPGYDCSGFAQEVLGAFGADPKGDQSADALYRYFKKNKDSRHSIEKGSLLFFGTRWKIVHVAIAIDSVNMIEAGGGGFRTRNRNAEVRIRPIKGRKDFVESIAVSYPLGYPVRFRLKGLARSQL